MHVREEEHIQLCMQIKSCNFLIMHVLDHVSYYRSFSPRPGEYQNPGLVQDGSKCGSDKVISLLLYCSKFSRICNFAEKCDSCKLVQLCFGQKCLPVADLKVPECPVGNGGTICSGQLNGVSIIIIIYYCKYCYHCCFLPDLQ